VYCQLQPLSILHALTYVDVILTFMFNKTVFLQPIATSQQCFIHYSHPIYSWEHLNISRWFRFIQYISFTV